MRARIQIGVGSAANVLETAGAPAIADGEHEVHDVRVGGRVDVVVRDPGRARTCRSRGSGSARSRRSCRRRAARASGPRGAGRSASSSSAATAPPQTRRSRLGRPRQLGASAGGSRRPGPATGAVGSRSRRSTADIGGVVRLVATRTKPAGGRLSIGLVVVGHECLLEQRGPIVHEDHDAASRLGDRARRERASTPAAGGRGSSARRGRACGWAVDRPAAQAAGDRRLASAPVERVVRVAAEAQLVVELRRG